MLDFIAFVVERNRKKERTKSPYLKAFQIKFRYGGSCFEKLALALKKSDNKFLLDKFLYK